MGRQGDELRLWGGRFAGGPTPAVSRLSRSITFDWRLADHDIAGSRAHARELHRVGLLDDGELATMLDGLDLLAADVRSGAFVPSEVDEDVHTALERGLIERIGVELGGKLRAGRSRNDQVVTLFRRYLREHARVIAARLVELEEALIGLAERHADLPMPGRTHMQHAQPVLFSHHLLAHAQALARDAWRLRDWDQRADVSPYGSGALAGTSFRIDPERIAAELGFSASAANSIDATSSRDFAAELCFVLAYMGVNLSRLAEEVVFWATHEFGFVTLDDAYATGSSIMPQKKNPDVAELSRGKAGRLVGDLTGLLTTLKGLPLAYNSDLQEDKEPLFDAVDTVEAMLPAVTGMIATLTVHGDRVASLAGASFSLATDMADWLVRQGLPFRDAHEIVGRVVRAAEERGRDLDGLADDELIEISPHFTPDVRSVLSVRASIESRSARGGTASARVREQIADLRRDLDRQRAFAR